MGADGSKAGWDGLTDSYEPRHRPRNKVLSTELQKQGGRSAIKQLTKARGWTPAATDDADEWSEWWGCCETPDRAKLAAAVMALQYDQLLRQLDGAEEELQMCRARAKRLEGEMATLGRQLRDWAVENEQLKAALRAAQERLQLLEGEVRAKDDHMKSLQQELREQRKENKTLSLEVFKQTQTSHDHDKKSPMHIELLNQLPDLKEKHSNYEFWKKIREFYIMGVDPYHILLLIQAKCPKATWNGLKESDLCGLKESDLCVTNYSKTKNTEELLQKYHKCLSAALSPGSTQYNVFLSRSQREGETFEDYIEEKFKLYCAYGCVDKEPDRNDPMFLFSTLQNAAKKYEDLRNFTSYSDLLSSVAIKDSLDIASKRKNQCKNCDRYGHSWTVCRRPGGGDEAGPGVCYTCGEYGHKARDCYD